MNEREAPSWGKRVRLFRGRYEVVANFVPFYTDRHTARHELVRNIALRREFNVRILCGEVDRSEKYASWLQFEADSAEDADRFLEHLHELEREIEAKYYTPKSTPQLHIDAVRDVELAVPKVAVGTDLGGCDIFIPFLLDGQDVVMEDEDAKQMLGISYEDAVALAEEVGEKAVLPRGKRVLLDRPIHGVDLEYALLLDTVNGVYLLAYDWEGEDPDSYRLPNDVRGWGDLKVKGEV